MGQWRAGPGEAETRLGGRGATGPSGGPEHLPGEALGQEADWEHIQAPPLPTARGVSAYPARSGCLAATGGDPEQEALRARGAAGRGSAPALRPLPPLVQTGHTPQGSRAHKVPSSALRGGSTAPTAPAVRVRSGKRPSPVAHLRFPEQLSIFKNIGTRAPVMDSPQEKYLFLPFPGQGKFLRWKNHLTIH